MRERPVKRFVLRLAALTATILAILAVTGAPGLAHVRVSADQPHAGAVAVTVTFTAEAESRTAGIASLRTILPAGITPGQVSYVSGPPGWALAAQPDGFTVGGPPLRPGENAAYAVRLARIPAGQSRLPLKTIQRYTDGRVDRWLDATKSVEAREPGAAPALILDAAPAPGAVQSPTAGGEPLAPAFDKYPREVWVAGGGAVLIALLVILWIRSRLV
jgi:hypothetical protein